MPIQRVDTPDGISWHVESFPPTAPNPQAEYIVLVPSGEGDAGATVAPAALLAAAGYHALTFDMPGMSRTQAPPSAYAHPVTPQRLAPQIIGLLDSLQIKRASFFGSSSGGSTVLGLVALYPERVKCGIVHEVPFTCPPALLEWQQLSDEQISMLCRDLFATRFVEANGGGQEKWAAMGAEYHARLERNYVTWMRGYGGGVELAGAKIAADPENLQKRPLFWTVGALNEGAQQGQGMWKEDFELAEKAGIDVEIQRLQCLHFPGVTVPEQLAAWIEECIGKVSD